MNSILEPVPSIYTTVQKPLRPEIKKHTKELGFEREWCLNSQEAEPAFLT